MALLGFLALALARSAVREARRERLHRALGLTRHSRDRPHQPPIRPEAPSLPQPVGRTLGQAPTGTRFSFESPEPVAAPPGVLPVTVPRRTRQLAAASADPVARPGPTPATPLARQSQQSQQSHQSPQALKAPLLALLQARATRRASLLTAALPPTAPDPIEGPATSQRPASVPPQAPQMLPQTPGIAIPPGWAPAIGQVAASWQQPDMPYPSAAPFAARPAAPAPFWPARFPSESLVAHPLPGSTAAEPPLAQALPGSVGALEQLREQLTRILQDDALRHGLNLKEG